MTTQISTQTISFNNQALITFEQNGKHYTAMKPICENIGLAWEAQLARIKRDEILSQGMIVIDHTFKWRKSTNDLPPDRIPQRLALRH